MCRALTLLRKPLLAHGPRGRVLALFTPVLLGGLAVGSAAWGGLASRFGITNALDVAAIGLIGGLFFSLRYRLIRLEDLSLTA